MQLFFVVYKYICLCGLLFSFGGMPALSQVFLEEDFSAGAMPPAGWTLENAADQWSVTPSSNAGGHAPEAAFQWVQLETTARLISPELNLEGVDSLFLTFRHMYDDYQGEGPAVGVATRSGGGAWTTVWEVLPESNVPAEKMNLHLFNEDVGQPDFQCCFYLTGNLFNLDYWYLDDIHLHLPAQIQVNMLLEGPWNGSMMSAQLNLQGQLPQNQPFEEHPWYYNGDETAIDLPPEVVDWVLLELWERDLEKQPAFSRYCLQAGFIRTDGSLTGPDGLEPPVFDIDQPDSLYLWIHHRNHLSLMSSKPLGEFGDVQSYDFTLQPDAAMHGKQVMKKAPGGRWVVAAGDGNADGQINNGDYYEVWMEQSGNNGYLSGDFNLDGQVNNADLLKYWQPNQGRMAWVPDTATIPFICGDTLFDLRDGNAYATVQVGSQCWMKENLRYDAGTNWCYYNDPVNCVTYGRLYSWNTIMNGASGSNTVPSGVQGICPEDWHVPSDAEWCELTTFIDNTINCDTSGYNGTDGGYSMKSDWGWSSGGNGSDAFGFSALPAGCMGIYHFDDLHLYTYFWSATEDYPGFALLMKLNYGLPTVGRYFSLKNRGYSLRCLH